MKVEKFGLRPLPCGVGFRHLGNYQILGNTLSRFSISSTSISHWNLHLSLRQHNHSWPSLDRKFPHVGIMFTMIEPSFKNSVLKGKIGCLLALLMASQITHLHRVGFVLHEKRKARSGSFWVFSVVQPLSPLEVGFAWSDFVQISLFLLTLSLLMALSTIVPTIGAFSFPAHDTTLTPLTVGESGGRLCGRRITRRSVSKKPAYGRCEATQYTQRERERGTKSITLLTKVCATVYKWTTTFVKGYKVTLYSDSLRATALYPIYTNGPNLG